VTLLTLSDRSRRSASTRHGSGSSSGCDGASSRCGSMWGRSTSCAMGRTVSAMLSRSFPSANSQREFLSFAARPGQARQAEGQRVRQELPAAHGPGIVQVPLEDALVLLRAVSRCRLGEPPSRYMQSPARRVASVSARTAS
jgi:hypothetical protein